jgi:hypothetical protein
MGIPRTRRLYNFGPFSLDATQRQVFKDNQVVALSPKVVGHAAITRREQWTYCHQG